MVRMLKKLSAILGGFLIIVALVMVSSLFVSNVQAILVDSESRSFGMVSDEAPPFCSWEATEPERVMSEDETQAIVVKVVNPAEEECATTLKLAAPGFELSPPESEYEINLPPKITGTVSWIIAPHKTGTYSISLSDPLSTKIYGIQVTNIFGLSTFWAQVLSGVGTVLGPALTFPWWWEKWLQRKQKPVDVSA
jgi:hypothetical protein